MSKGSESVPIDFTQDCERRIEESKKKRGLRIRNHQRTPSQRDERAAAMNSYQVALQDFQTVPIDLSQSEDMNKRQIRETRRNKQASSTASAIYQSDDPKKQRKAFLYFYVIANERPTDKQVRDRAVEEETTGRKEERERECVCVSSDSF